MSDSRKLRTGPTDGGRWEANTARSRVTPPSTGSTYTTSASATPVQGRPCGELSTFTARTAAPAAPGSPVSGEAAATRTGAAVAAGGPGRGGVPPRVLQMTTPMTTAITTAITSASALVASEPS